MTPQKIAIVAITLHGARHASRLAEAMPEAHVVVAAKVAHEVTVDPTRVTTYEGSIKPHVAPLMERFDLIALFVSLGAVVRLIAPYLRSKDEDPGIVVVDDAARFVIPALAGHVGGANAFALRIASLIDATPVVTTASDAGKTIPVDILGRELGWRVDAPKQNVTTVSACVVNEEPIAFVQECGSPDWWTRPTPLPTNIVRYDRIEAVDFTDNPALLWVTEREIDPALADRLGERWVIYRTPEEAA